MEPARQMLIDDAWLEVLVVLVFQTLFLQDAVLILLKILLVFSMFLPCCLLFHQTMLCFG